jgi:hypothetical protein
MVDTIRSANRVWIKRPQRALHDSLQRVGGRSAGHGFVIIGIEFLKRRLPDSYSEVRQIADLAPHDLELTGITKPVVTTAPDEDAFVAFTERTS